MLLITIKESKYKLYASGYFCVKQLCTHLQSIKVIVDHANHLTFTHFLLP